VIPFEWLEQAEARIAPHILHTPLTYDPERELFLKWENHQVTGSFKPRGAINKVLSLEDWERKAGLVASSAGNHGQGVALAGGLTGAPVEVFVSNHAVPAKVEAMKSLGAQVHFVEGGYGEAEAAGRRYAEREQKVFISPYNDGQVIAGQGTMGLEILRSLANDDPKDATGQGSTTNAKGLPIANWIVPIGGGGLISAFGTLFTQLNPRPKLIGVQAAASPFTHSLFHRHTQTGMEDLPTLADGLSGAVEEHSVTIPMIEKFVDDFMIVSEDEIARAMVFAWQVYHEKIEGSGAVGLAAILAGKVNEKPSVVVITGGNVQPEVHEKLISQYAVRQ